MTAPSATNPDRGALLYEYAPPRAHPIVYAGLLVFGFVWMTGSIEVALRGAEARLYLIYGAPFLLTLFAYLAGFPTIVRIHAHGIAPARPLVLRWHRPFVRWDELAAVYPTYYDVTGAFVSPFASSDGKVTQLGVGLEWPDGHVETIRFTPSKFVAWRPRSAGFKGAWDAVVHAFGDRALVPTAPTYTEAQREAMLAEARKPFLPFFAIVFLFASAAPVLWMLIALAGLHVAVALPLALVPPIGVSTRSWLRSRARNRILNALSKAAAYEEQELRRTNAAGPAKTDPDGTDQMTTGPDGPSPGTTDPGGPMAADSRSTAVTP